MGRMFQWFAVLLGIVGGAVLGLREPTLGVAWGGIYGLVFSAFLSQMIAGRGL